MVYWKLILSFAAVSFVLADIGIKSNGPCENNGEFLPHTSDCSKFYKCVNNELITRQCPSELLWSDKDKVCDGPKNARCEHSNQTTFSGSCEVSAPPPICPDYDLTEGQAVHLPHQYDCTKFYKCDLGLPYLMDCPDSLYFNPKLEVCDWPKDAGCECAQEVTTDAPIYTTVDAGSGDGGSGDGGSGDGIESCDRTSPPPTCPDHDPLGPAVHLPHQYDCTKFYKCDWDSLFLFDCPTGLHFNPVLKVCDYPEDAGCECAREQSIHIRIERSLDGGSGDGPGSCDIAAPIPLCPEQDPDGPAVHLPHQFDCTKFYKCDWGIPFLFDCPANLHFNPKLQVCDYPSNAHCECAEDVTYLIRREKRETTLDEGSGDGGSGDGGSGDGPASCDITSPPPTCPEHDPFGEAVHLPHQYDCTKFYTCDWGILFEFDCPVGTHFNPKLEVCDWPEDAGCKCAEKIPTHSRKQRSLENRNAERAGSCDFAASTPVCPDHDPNGPAIHLPHQYDCTKFYKCDWGKPYVFDCPAGLHFNPKLEVCDWPRDAGCTCSGGVTTPAPIETTPDGGSGDGSTTCDVLRPPPDCSDFKEDLTYVPHQYNCSQFYKCESGERTLIDCAPGLLFSSKLKLCDWPENVVCECPSEDTDIFNR